MVKENFMCPEYCLSYFTIVERNGLDFALALAKTFSSGWIEEAHWLFRLSMAYACGVEGP